MKNKLFNRKMRQSLVYHESKLLWRYLQNHSPTDRLSSYFVEFPTLEKHEFSTLIFSPYLSFFWGTWIASIAFRKFQGHVSFRPTFVSKTIPNGYFWQLIPIR